jgi:hypothetical protein
MAVKIIIRHDTATNWTSYNPTLAVGEVGLETNTKKFKIGDGATAWTSLGYATNSVSEISSAITAAIDALDTDDIEEGSTNLYYTEARAKTDAAELLTGATLSNITITGNGSGLTITAENGVADSDTDDLTEGTTNLYYTDARVDSHLSGGDGISYLTGTISADLATNGGLEIATGQIQIDRTTVDTWYDASGAASTAETNATDYTDDLIGDVTVDGTTGNTVTDRISGAVGAHSIETNGVHGLIGDVVGTTDIQTLSYKTLGTELDADGNTVTNLATPSLNTDAATKGYVDTAVAGIVDTAPALLDTLNELAAAIGDDANFSTTVATSIGTKVSKAGDTMTGALVLSGAPTTGLHAATKGYVDDEVTAHNRTTEIHGISDTNNLAYLTDVSTAVENHSDATVSIHGITDTANLVYKESPTLTGNVSLPSTTTIGTVTGSEIALLSGLTASGTELSILDGATLSTAELNTLDGILSSTAELNILNGVTASTAEINLLDGLTSSTLELNILTGITASTSELNILDGVTATASELNTLDGITASTSELNILDGATLTTSELNTLSGVTATAAEINILSGAMISTAELNTLDGITASVAELNILDGVTATAVEINLLSGATLSTAELNTLDGLTATTTELNYVDGVTSAIQTQLDAKSPINDPTFTGTVSGITKSMVGLGNVDNTADVDKPISTATQGALDLKAPSANATFSGTISLPSTTSIGDVSSTEIGYVNGVTSAIQTQLDAKAALSGATFTGSVEIPGLTITGNLVVQGTTTTVSAADLKLRDNMIYLNQAGASVITNAVGDGTSVVYTTQATHGYEAGDYVTVSDVTPSSFNISGDGLQITAVTSTTFTVTSTVTDTYTSGGTARGKVHFNPDLGWAAGRYDTVNGVGYAHAGMFRDASDGVFKIFDGYTPEPDDAIFINTAHSSFGLAPIAVESLTADSATIGDVSNTELQYLNGVTSAIQTQLDSKAPTADPTFTGTVTVSASGVAFTDATQTKAGVPSISVFATKTASYTVGADSGTAERDLIILVDSTSSATVSIPTDATTNFPVGTSFDVIRLNTGALNIAAANAGTTSVVATPGLNLRARYSSATCLKIGSNSWIVYGDLAS